MNIREFLTSTIGKKCLVAVTGLFIIFYLLAHLAGNLQVFYGPNAVNNYAVFLRSMPVVLWGFRIALLLSFIIHIWLTISLTARNRDARKDRYLVKKSRKASLASRTMMISGLTVLVFVLYHLCHYTLGITNPEYLHLVDEQGRHNVYNMVVLGFSHPLVVMFYILAQILLAFHLSHGIASTTRTLGCNNGVIYNRVRKLGVLFAAVIALLYISIPVSVFFGLLPLTAL